MKRFYLILSLVAMLFTSCEGFLGNDSNADGSGDGTGTGTGSGIVADEEQIALIVLNDMYFESSTNESTDDAKAAIYLQYDANGRIECIHYSIIVDNYPKYNTTQTISYGTPVTITSKVQEIVKYTNPDKTVLRSYEGTSGTAYFNSLGCLSSLTYGDYFSCTIGYDATTGRISSYTGGSGKTMPFTWENDNLMSIEDITFSYSDKLATWGGFDWVFMMANGFEEEQMLLCTLNTNRGLHSKNLPSAISAEGKTQSFTYTFDEDGRVKSVEFDGESFEIFYKNNPLPTWPWEPFDEKVVE